MRPTDAPASSPTAAKTGSPTRADGVRTARFAPSGPNGQVRAAAFVHAATIGLFICVAATLVFCFNIVLRQFARPMLLALGMTVFLSPMHHHVCLAALAWARWARSLRQPLLFAIVLTIVQICASVVCLVPVPDSWWDIIRASQDGSSELFSPIATDDKDDDGDDDDNTDDDRAETLPNTDTPTAASATDTTTTTGSGTDAAISKSRPKRPSIRRLVRSMARATVADVKNNPAARYLAGFSGLAVVGMVLVHMVLNIEPNLDVTSVEGIIQDHLGALWLLFPVCLLALAVLFHVNGFHACAKSVVILILADWTFVLLSVCSRFYVFSILPFVAVYAGASLVINRALSVSSVSWRGIGLLFCVVVIVDVYGVGYFVLGLSVLAGVRVVGIVVRGEMVRQELTPALVTSSVSGFWEASVPHVVHVAYDDYVRLEISCLDWVIKDLQVPRPQAVPPSVAPPVSSPQATLSPPSHRGEPSTSTSSTAQDTAPRLPTRRSNPNRGPKSRRPRSRSRQRPRVQAPEPIHVPVPALHLPLPPSPLAGRRRASKVTINRAGTVSSCVAVSLVVVLTLAAVLLGLTLSARGYSDMTRLTQASTPKELAGFRDVLVVSQRWTSKPSDVDTTYNTILNWVNKAKADISKDGPNIVASFVSSFMLGDAMSKDAVLEAFNNITTAFAEVGSPESLTTSSDVCAVGADGLTECHAQSSAQVPSPSPYTSSSSSPSSASVSILGTITHMSSRLSHLGTRLASGSVAKELATTGWRFLTAIGAATQITWRLLLSQMIQPMLSLLNGFIEGVVFYSVLLLLLLYGSADELAGMLSLVAPTPAEQRLLGKTINASMHGVLAFTLKMPFMHGLFMWASYETMDVNGVLGPCLWSVIAAGIAVVGIAPVYIVALPGILELAVQGRSSFAVVFAILHVLVSQRLSELIAEEVQAGLKQSALRGGEARPSPLLHPYVIGLSVYGGWCAMPDVFGVFLGPAAICLLVVLSAAIRSSVSLKEQPNK